MSGSRLRCFGFVPTPSRDFVPAADSLFAPPKSKQKALPCETAPAGSPAMLEAQGRAELASLRSARTVVAKSVLEACCARALGFCASRRFRRGGSEQPAAKPESRSVDVFRMPPFSPAEERKALRPRAQHASRTDSAQLFDRSVAKGVLRGASRTEHRREPRSEAQGRGGQGGAFCLLFGGPKSRSPAGAKSRHGPRDQPILRGATP
jgi:hypothetical protein